MKTHISDNDNNLKEEKMLANQTKKEVPHWLRRQIGSVLPSWRNHSRKEWSVPLNWFLSYL